MKKTILILALCGIAFGQSKTTNVGNAFVSIQTVTWSGADSIVLTFASPNAVSDAFPMQINGVKPASSVTFAYEIKALDSMSSNVKHLVESKLCSDPVRLSGCDSTWTLSGYHGIYGNQNINDTLDNPGALKGTYRAVTDPFQVSAHNLFRITTIGTIASGKTVTIRRAKGIGE